MKKVLALVGFVLLISYLIFSAFFFKDTPKEHTCKGFEVIVENNDGTTHFVNADELDKYINEKGLNPVGKQLKNINTSQIEDLVKGNHLVKDALAYITGDGTIRIKIIERKPILRIISNTGGSYYIDSDGEKMSLSKNFTAYLPIATGAIKEDFAKGDLYKFALFLSKDEFWNAQIEQMVVANNNEVRLVPRVGNQQILLGQLDGYKEKLDKLMLFYKEGQNKLGWNKYSVINLKYDKQIVCTKR